VSIRSTPSLPLDYHLNMLRDRGQDAVGFPTQHHASCGPRFFTHSRRIPAGSEAMALDVLEDVCDGVLDKGDKLTK
jgi:hypothetical protein